jgi:hypothetical protein
MSGMESSAARGSVKRWIERSCRRAFISGVLTAIPIGHVTAPHPVRQFVEQQAVWSNPVSSTNAMFEIHRSRDEVVTLQTPATSSVSRPCIYREEGRMWCQGVEVKELKPRFNEDMAMCGESLEQYQVTRFGAGSQAILEKKKRLDATERRRAIERTKWAWLHPTVVDLALFSEAIGCHERTEVETFLSKHGFVSYPATVPVERAGVQLFREYRRKESDNGTVVTMVIRSPDDDYFDKNPADRLRSESLLWVSLNFRKESPYRLTSKEYWIDCVELALKTQSDYWDERLKGFTLPGGDSKWGSFGREPLARMAQNVLCGSMK